MDLSQDTESGSDLTLPRITMWCSATFGPGDLEHDDLAFIEKVLPQMVSTLLDNRIGPLLLPVLSDKDGWTLRDIASHYAVLVTLPNKSPYKDYGVWMPAGLSSLLRNACGPRLVGEVHIALDDIARHSIITGIRQHTEE